MPAGQGPREPTGLRSRPRSPGGGSILLCLFAGRGNGASLSESPGGLAVWVLRVHISFLFLFVCHILIYFLIQCMRVTLGNKII